MDAVFGRFPRRKSKGKYLIAILGAFLRLRGFFFF